MLITPSQKNNPQYPRSHRLQGRQRRRTLPGIRDRHLRLYRPRRPRRVRSFSALVLTLLLLLLLAGFFSAIWFLLR